MIPPDQFRLGFITDAVTGRGDLRKGKAPDFAQETEGASPAGQGLPGSRLEETG
ncbi:MAG: hypothetical protein LBP88_04475 [Treponema sp.]|nr:hypothetical protein [Treponema sp.]